MEVNNRKEFDNMDNFVFQFFSKEKNLIWKKVDAITSLGLKKNGSNNDTQYFFLVEWPARTYIKQLCMDTGCRLEHHLELMDNKDGGWERIREMCASGTAWWFSNISPIDGILMDTTNIG